MKQKIFTITDWVHSILSSYVEEGAICVDATAGKGKDTLFLCRYVGDTGKVYAFDVQEEAIAQAKETVGKAGYADRAVFILDGHENMDAYLGGEEASVVLFNLGYLPGGDHSVATGKETTLIAAKKALACLKKEGIMCIVIYSGGDTGFEEKDAVLAWASSLPAKDFDVIGSPFLNKPNCPPMPVFIRKR